MQTPWTLILKPIPYPEQVKNCDRTIVMDKGHVMENGPPEVSDVQSEGRESLFL